MLSVICCANPGPCGTVLTVTKGSLRSIMWCITACVSTDISPDLLASQSYTTSTGFPEGTDSTALKNSITPGAEGAVTSPNGGSIINTVNSTASTTTYISPSGHSRERHPTLLGAASAPPPSMSASPGMTRREASGAVGSMSAASVSTAPALGGRT